MTTNACPPCIQVTRGSRHGLDYAFNSKPQKNLDSPGTRQLPSLSRTQTPLSREQFKERAFQSPLKVTGCFSRWLQTCSRISFPAMFYSATLKPLGRKEGEESWIYLLIANKSASEPCSTAMERRGTMPFFLDQPCRGESPKFSLLMRARCAHLIRGRILKFTNNFKGPQTLLESVQELYLFLAPLYLWLYPIFQFHPSISLEKYMERTISF